MRTAGHPLNLLNVIRYIGLLQYPRKIIQLGEARSEHTDCVLDPVDTDDRTATSRSYLEVVRNVLLLHRRAERGAKLIRELIKQRLDTRDSSSNVGVIVTIDERLEARALELILWPFTVHEQRGRAFVRVERRIVERQVLPEFYVNIKVAVVAKQSTTRVRVLEEQVIEREQVFTLQLLHRTIFSVERREGALTISELYLNRR